MSALDVADAVAAGDADVAWLEPPAGVLAAEARPGGTAVVAGPSRTSTWPAGSALLATAVTPKYPAIFAALADAPVP